MDTVYLDTETCGFHGPIVLMQFAVNDGPVTLWNIWKEPIKDTLEVIEIITSAGVVAFNLAFDWFHVCQLYTTLTLLAREVGSSEAPEDHIDTYALLEPAARDGLCLKPASALDLMLHARKGPYQSTMGRKPIRIRRVPEAIAYRLVAHLDERIRFRDIHFAKKKDKNKRWTVYDIRDDLGTLIPFKDVGVSFAPSSALKALVVDAGIVAEADVIRFGDLDDLAKPTEYGYAPFALAVGDPSNWHNAWPVHIRVHISRWAHHPHARRYAEDDVIYLQKLHAFFGNPPIGDDDSELAAMVGAVRWRGFAVDIPGMSLFRATAKAKQLAVHKKIAIAGNIPFTPGEVPDTYHYRSVRKVRKYLFQKMSPTERLALSEGTGGVILEVLSRWTVSDVCGRCDGMGCTDCNDGLVATDVPHPVAERARDIIEGRKADKDVTLFDKILLAGRFHASLNVGGAKSWRMSGADGLNPQGIQSSKAIRRLFTMANAPDKLDGGDFAAFELSIMDAAYHDPRMHQELVSGIKLHAAWGERYFFCDRGVTYDEILETKGLIGDADLYGRAKSMVFAICYFGEVHTLVTRGGIPESVASDAYQRILEDYLDFAAARNDVLAMFCSMKQPGGIGTRVDWSEPAGYIESLQGFKRYFNLEHQVCRALFDLAENPPPDLRIKGTVTRRDREQTVQGATRSALFAAAFNIQGQNMRAAGNHRIQSTGSIATKQVQRKIWDIQPPGINHWRVQPINIHDEIIVVRHSAYGDVIERAVTDEVEAIRRIIPLLSIEWSQGIASWAEK